jgi:hypothetical protein
MKAHFLSIFLITIAVTGFSQTFNWATNDTIETNLAQNTTVLLKMEQNAIGVDTVTLGIKVIYNDVPSYWDGMICIEGVCLGHIADTGTVSQMTPISGADRGYVRLTVNPMNGSEIAKLQVYVFDINYPNDGDTATWLLNTNVVGMDEINFDSYLELYPNPVNNILNFNSKHKLNQIEIININGTVTESIEQISNFSGSINLEHYPQGVYFIRYIDESGTIATDKFIKE